MSTISIELRHAFNFYRAHVLRDSQSGRVTFQHAWHALELARKDIAAGRKHYTSSPWRKPVGNGARSERGAQWIERPADMGLRFVGYCDTIAKIDHTGWFTDESQDSTIRGVVYQLPGRNGKARYVAGHDNSDNGAADSGGPAYIDWSQIFESDFEDEMRRALAGMSKHYHTAERLRPGYWAEAAHESARKEAAYAAEEFTRVEAEKEREYSRAWQAGALWAETGEDIKSARKDALDLLRERRQARAAGLSGYVTICETIETAIRDSLEFISECRDKRAKLASGDYEEGDRYLGFLTGDKKLAAAFNDGAGQTVIA